MRNILALMNAVAIAPLRRALVGARACVPASKSVANRELVLSAIAGGRSRLDVGPLDPGDDVHAMVEALRALGHDVGWLGERIEVVPRRSAQAHAAIDAAEAGTVARFVTALAALGDAETRIDGSARLRERPMAGLTAALRTLGAVIDGDRLPLTVHGPLDGGEVVVPGHESSQFASALLLVAPAMRRGLRLRIAGGLVSAPFLDLTIAALERRGVRVERPAPLAFEIAPQPVGARTARIPGDITAATYPAAAAAILGGEVTITNAVTRGDHGGQGDVRFFDLLEAMGCRVRRGTSTAVSRRGPLHGVVAGVSDCSDVFPTLAVVATVADTPTELSGLAHTRAQESDRIEAVAGGIRALGGDVTTFHDGLRITPVPLHAGVIDAAGDHRIAMAFSVLGLLVPGVSVSGAESVSKTFPSFYEMLDALRRRR